MNSLVTLITFTLPQDAYLAKSLLESEGIDVYLKDELTTQVHNFYSNAVGGVKIQVMEDDYDTGLKILKDGGYILEEGTSSTIVEWVDSDHSMPKNRCPFCSSHNMGKKKEADILVVILYFILGAFFPIFRKSFICYDCGKVWKYKK